MLESSGVAWRHEGSSVTHLTKTQVTGAQSAAILSHRGVAAPKALVLNNAKQTFFHSRFCLTAMVFLCFIVVWLSVFNTAEAQQPAADAGTTFSVSAFNIEGDNPLSQQETDKILAPYLNRQIDIEGLREAATEIEKRLAQRGYNFLRTTLPPQELVDDTVTLEIAAISIAEVSVIGNEYFSNENIERSLPLVAAGKSPNTQKIASALLLAEDNPAKDVRVVFVKGEQPQTVSANITVKDQNPNEFFAWANNGGSRDTSRSRLGLQYHNRNLWDRDHQLALSYAFSPQDPDELEQYGLNYRMPIFTTRGMANLFFSRSNADTGRVADVFDVSGAGETIGIGYRQYLDKRGNYQHRLGVNLVDKLFDSDILFADENIGNDVRSRPLTVEYISRWDAAQWVVNSIVSASSNTSGGSFNDDASYQRTRAQAQQNWSKQNLSLRLDYRFNREWRARWLLFAQNTSDALIPGEKFGLGGALGDPGPRGFLEREVSVDKGFKTSFEVLRRIGSKPLTVGAFVDYADGKQNFLQVGEVADESLSSLGMTLRWDLRSNLSLNVEYGYIMDGVDQRFGRAGSDDGDDRWHLSLRYFPKWPFARILDRSKGV